MEETTKRLTAQRPQVVKISQPLEVSHHKFEDYLASPYMRRFLRLLTARRGDDHCYLEKVFQTYDAPNLGLLDRLKYLIPHQVIELFRARAGISRNEIKQNVFQRPERMRALVNTARSIATFGLTTPQRFVAPLLVVWNITQACNLACKHCYQNATHKPQADELSWEEKQNVLDQLADNYVPLLAIAGGEPLVCKDFWKVLAHCRKRQIYVTVATNGTMLSKEVCQRLVEAGVKYVEVSIDSCDPEEHDNLRGMKGAWARSVQGIKNVANTPGLRAGMATCVTRQNIPRVDEVIQLAKDLGCATFAHFNFIPVGRGAEIAAWDLTPSQRENLLVMLNRHLQEGEISIISTAPQFGRACLIHAGPDGLMASAHVGSGKGKQVRVLARYVGGCGAGRCYCSIQPNGKVTPCVYIPSLVMGDLRRQSFEQIWNNPRFTVLADREDRGDHCGVCDFRHYCGGCRARALGYTGDIQAGDPGCMYNIHLWEEITNSAEAQPVAPTENYSPDNFLAGTTGGNPPGQERVPDILLSQLDKVIDDVLGRRKSTED